MSDFSNFPAQPEGTFGDVSLNYLPMKIPAKYLPLMPYLIVHRSAAFAEFTKAVFGATEQELATSDAGTIMHGELRIGEAVIMFSEASEQWPEKTAAMYLHVTDVDQIYRTALTQGAKPLHAPGQQDYGYTAGFADPFGNHWFIVAAGAD
jgi:PhnB protein